MTRPPTVLLRTLDAGRFKYAVRHLRDGTPYAGFRWSGPPDLPEMGFTAQERAGELR